MSGLSDEWQWRFRWCQFKARGGGLTAQELWPMSKETHQSALEKESKEKESKEKGNRENDE